MPIKNYTTKVDASKTVGEIQQMLAQHGAKQIMLDYSDGKITCICFTLQTANGIQGVRLPANPERTLAVLQRQNIKSADMEQARRVAWRILKDWLDAQLAILETEMVTIDQVMLPYFVTKSGDTVYELYQNNQFLLEG